MLFFTQAALAILSVLTSSVAASSPPPAATTTDILYWPMASSQPLLLARVSYDSTSLKSDVLSYTPPPALLTRENESEDLVRVGLSTSTPSDPRHWVGTLTSLSSLIGNGDRKPTIQLHLGPSNEVYHVSLGRQLSSSDTSVSSPRIELVPTKTGPRPHLNRPIVVSPDGQGTQEVVDKTFFQKYWWVFLIVTFLAMSGGGEGQQ